MIQKKYRFHLYIVLLAAISLIVTLVNLGVEKNFVGEDSGVSFNFPDTLQELTYFMWDSHSAPGKPNISSVFNFIWNNFILILSNLGLSGLLLKRFLFFLFFFASGFGMFNLSRYLLSIHFKIDTGAVLFSSFISAFIYMLNPYTAQLASFPIINYHSSYIFFPWVFLVFISNLNKRVTFVNIFIFALLLVLIISANPSNTFIIITFLSLYFFYFIRQHKNPIRENVIFLSLAIFLFILLCSFIFLPVLGLQTNIYGIEKIEALDFYGSIKLHSTFTSFLNLFRLIGSREWPTFPYSWTYDNSLIFLVLSFSVPVAAFSSLLFNTARKEKAFYLVTALLFIFVAKGVHEPLPEISLFLFKTFPILGIFRAVYFKFMFPVVLSYAILVGFMVIEITKNKNIHQHSKKLPLIIFFIAFLYNYPFFLGLIPKQHYLNNIPKNYTRLVEFFRNRADGKILSLPETPNGSGPIMRWSNDIYIGPQTDFFFTDRPTFDGYWFISRKFPGLENLSWDKTTLVEKTDNLIKLAGVLNLRFFLLHKDFIHEFEFPTSAGKVVLNGPLKYKIASQKLQSHPQLKLISTTENYDIYERNFMPEWEKIYSPENLLFASDVKQVLAKPGLPLDRKYAVLNYDEQDKTGFIQTRSQPDISFREKNPTSYEISLKNPSYPLLLIFSETFHPQWKLKNSKGQQIAESNHLKVNDYANAWLIENDSEFKLDFVPQRYFNTGLVISSLTFLCCLIMLIYELAFRHKK